jgi:hypothetical protein
MYWSINQEKNTLSTNYAKAAKCAGLNKNLTRQKDIGVNWAVYDGYNDIQKDR